MVSKKPRRPVVDLEGEDESEIAAIDSLIAGHDISMVCPDAPGSVDDSGRKIVRPAIKYGERPEPRRKIGEEDSVQTKAVPPPHYRCHRCGEPGHYIYDCPTNDDPTYTSKQKVKSARGVPRQFLRIVTREEAQDLTEDVYILPNGDYAVMKQVSDEERKKIVGESEKERLTRVFSDADWRVQGLLLSCGICHQLPVEAEITPCCANLYCRKCVVEHLAKTHSCVDGTLWPNKCPGCNETLKLSSLIPDIRLRDQLHFVAYGKRLPTRKPHSLAHAAKEGRKRSSGSKLLRKSSKKSRLELNVTLGSSAAAGSNRADMEKFVVTKGINVIAFLASHLRLLLTVSIMEIMLSWFETHQYCITLSACLASIIIWASQEYRSFSAVGGWGFERNVFWDDWGMSGVFTIVACVINGEGKWCLMHFSSWWSAETSEDHGSSSGSNSNSCVAFD